MRRSLVLLLCSECHLLTPSASQTAATGGAASAGGATLKPSTLMTEAEPALSLSVGETNRRRSCRLSDVGRDAERRRDAETCPQAMSKATGTARLRGARGYGYGPARPSWMLGHSVASSFGLSIARSRVEAMPLRGWRSRDVEGNRARNGLGTSACSAWADVTFN